MYFTSNDGSENMFVYQPTLDTLELKKEKGTYYVLSWKSSGVYNSKLKPLYTASVHSLKHFGCQMGLNFNEDPLDVEQNNYLTKISNVYIVYDLAAMSKIPLKSFELKNYLFGVTNIIKISDKDKWVFGGYGGADWWNFGNITARNVIFFGVDNSSSSYVDNLKNGFLILGNALVNL